MPAAWAVNEIPPGGPAQAPAAGTVTAGGMPGWQITLIALGAALVAATAAVLAGPDAGRSPGSLGNRHLTCTSGRDGRKQWPRLDLVKVQARRRRRTLHQ